MPPSLRPPRPSAAQKAEAFRHLERAVAAHPDDPKARYNLALMLLERGRRDAARGHLETALRREPSFAPASFALGRLAEEDGDLAAAARLLSTAATAPAFAVQARFVLAGVLAAMAGSPKRRRSTPG